MHNYDYILFNHYNHISAWCNGLCNRLECGRSWVQAPVKSNQRNEKGMYLLLHR